MVRLPFHTVHKKAFTFHLLKKKDLISKQKPSGNVPSPKETSERTSWVWGAGRDTVSGFWVAAQHAIWRDTNMVGHQVPSVDEDLTFGLEALRGPG